jgi:pyruvate ferredoxin oxidoreductase gamma subunit
VLQVRFHGRGGQGVVTAAELLSVAAFNEGKHAQAFPIFGSERTGAPVAAFCRIDDGPIRTHEPVSEPDIVIIQDPTLLHQVEVFAGLREGGTVLINTARHTDELGLADVSDHFRLLPVPATELAREHLGRPMPGAPLLGALCAIESAASIDALEAAIRERFAGAAADGNVAAARAAHELETARVAGEMEAA